jgi:hypothetical protein
MKRQSGAEQMALHDWVATTGWEGVHLFWMTGLARWLKGKLPPSYRAYIGASPMLGVDIAAKPDVSVQSTISGESRNGPQSSAIATVETMHPDIEVAVATLAEEHSVQIEHEGRLISAIEIVSPRNKDRPESRAHYGSRYLGYLQNGVHLMLIDVHPRPIGFSFAALLGNELQLPATTLSAPQALSYRVGEPAAQGGRLLGVWQRPLTVGDKLPSLPLALHGQELIVVDLDSTYDGAAADAYLG